MKKRPVGRPATRHGPHRIEAYFSGKELAAIRRAAKRAKVPVSHWVRGVLLAAT